MPTGRIYKTSSLLVDNFNYPYAATFAHSAVHRDVIIQAQDYDDTITDLLPGEYLIVTVAGTNPHLVFGVSCDQEAQIQFFEDTTVSANGTEIITARLNRTSSETTVTKVYTGPTITTDGTELPGGFIPSAGGPVTAAGGATVMHRDAEWLLKAGTNYLVRVTPVAAAAMSIKFEWYE